MIPTYLSGNLCLNCSNAILTKTPSSGLVCALPINSTLSELPLALSFKAFGMFKGQMIQQMDTVLEMQKAMGAATESDFDDIKSMFLETNIYLLILTGV